MDIFLEQLYKEFHRPLQNPVLIFSIILFVILITPILFKRFNIPSIIGLIIAGVVLGPHAWNLIEKNEAIELFSTIGLLYIMFIAGLELDINNFKKNQNKSLTFGFLTFFVPIVLGYPVCRYFLGYDENASFLTASMFATHTLVSYPIVSRLGISKHHAVGISVGGTILTDTAVLIILAFILANSHGQLDAAFVTRLCVSLAIFCVIMFYLVPPFSRWFFNRLESEHHSHYIFVLSIVFFAAFLSKLAGVEPIIGAFFAGLALNKLIPQTSPLMNRIEFIGNALFIPFFLFGVGMIVDLNVLFGSSKAWIVAGTLTVFAIISKWIAAFITQKIFKYTNQERQLIFGLSSAHAAATLAIILLGYKNKILDENILNGTIILILVTCIFASFATERAAKLIVALSGKSGQDEDFELEMRNEHILIPIEEDDDEPNIIDLAIALKSKKSQQPLTMLSIIDYDDEAEINILREKHRLTNLINSAASVETKVNFISTIDHNSGSGIARTSREMMANIILMPWPSTQTIIDRFMGEKIESIVNYTDKTIFIAYIKNPMISFKRVVFAVPPMAEKENGFMQCVNKVLLFCKNLNLNLHCISTVETFGSIQEVDNYLGYATVFTHYTFSDWEDFLILSKEMKDRDIFILMSARRGSPAYSNALESVPAKMEKYFEGDKILVYPQQFSNIKHYTQYMDVNAEPISKGIRIFNRLKKMIEKK